MNEKFNPKWIKDGGRKEVNVSYIPNGSPDALVLANYYRELLKDKVLGEDEELMQLVLMHIEEIRPRFSAVLELFSKGDSIGSVAVYSSLLENGQSMVDYWYGNEVDPSNFPTQISDFNARMSADGITGVQKITSPIKHGKVDGVSVTFVFA